MTLRPGFFLTGNAWLDDDGLHVWAAHDCVDCRSVHLLPWPTWSAGDTTVAPSFSCDLCGFHASLWLGSREEAVVT